MTTKITQTKTLAKTLEILKSFDDLNTHQKASEIARKLDLNISTVSRHLADLVNYGFLEYDAGHNCYYLGVAVISLGGIALNSNDVYKIAYHEVQGLSRKLDLHACMSILRGTDIIYLFDICTETSFKLLMPVGYARPAATAAMGRVMMTDLTYQSAYSLVAKTKINKMTPYSITAIDEIMEKIDEARETSYSVLVDEIMVGTSSIATAVRNKKGKIIGAIALSVESSRLTKEYEKEIVNHLLITATNISAKLGYFVR